MRRKLLSPLCINTCMCEDWEAVYASLRRRSFEQALALALTIYWDAALSSPVCLGFPVCWVWGHTQIYLRSVPWLKRMEPIIHSSTNRGSAVGGISIWMCTQFRPGGEFILLFYKTTLNKKRALYSIFFILGLFSYIDKKWNFWFEKLYIRRIIYSNNYILCLFPYTE